MIQEPDDLRDDAMSFLWRDGDGEVAVFAQAERRLTSLTARIASANGPVHIHCESLAVHGVIAHAGRDFVCLDTELGQTYVRLAAIVKIIGLPAQVHAQTPDNSLSPLVSMLQHRVGHTLTCHFSTGKVLHGVLGHVFSDHLELVVGGAVSSIGSAEDSRSNPPNVAVVLAKVDAISSVRGA